MLLPEPLCSEGSHSQRHFNSPSRGPLCSFAVFRPIVLLRLPRTSIPSCFDRAATTSCTATGRRAFSRKRSTSPPWRMRKRWVHLTQHFKPYRWSRAHFGEMFAVIFGAIFHRPPGSADLVTARFNKSDDPPSDLRELKPRDAKTTSLKVAITYAGV